MEGFTFDGLIDELGVATIVQAAVLVFFAFRRRLSSTRALAFQLIFLGALQFLFVNRGTLGQTMIWQVGFATALLLGPAIYFWVKAFFAKKISHVLPHLVAAIACVNLVAYSLISYMVLGYLVGLHLLTYMVQIVVLVRKETASRGIELFSNPGSRLRWFRHHLLILLILGLYIGIQLVLHQSYFTPVFSLILSINILLVFLQVVVETSFFSDIPLGQKYAKSSLTAEQKFSILNRLEAIMEQEKYYLSSDASLTELADKLKTTPHNLSQVLNENKRSFFDMISAYRMQEACTLLRDPHHQQLKVEEIASMVGYNSKSAFNTAFKKFTGLTPTEFKRSKRVLTYGEEHLAHRKLLQNARKPHTFDQVKNLFGMINNFFKFFVRNFQRNKLFSFINLFGLTMAFASSILIYLFIEDELSFDKSIPNHEQIYRLYWQTEQPQTRTPHPMAQALVRDFPEVGNAVSISPWYGPGLSKQSVSIRNVNNNISFEEPNFFFADSTFFDVFDLELIRGNKATALTTIGGIVITESIAKKYFGDENPMGQPLSVQNDTSALRVTGVVEDLPKNTHFHFNFLFSYTSLKAMSPNSHWMSWQDFGHFNYIKINSGADVAGLEDKIQGWSLGYFNWPDHAAQRLLDGEVRFRLQPISEIHLQSNLKWELETNGKILYVYILSGTLIFILLIAAINYINLTTAKSLERAKEIGVKKTLGALRSDLSFQFLFESVLLCLAALTIALIIVGALLNEFNGLASKQFVIDDLWNVSFISRAMIMATAIGTLSGLYPASILSSFLPTEMLKGRFTTSKIGAGVRSSLVVVQFLVSAGLICGSLIILKQINFLKDRALGFEKEHVITVPIKDYRLLERFDAVKRELEQVNGVIAVSAASNVPGGQFNQNPAHIAGRPDELVDVTEFRVDYDVFEVLNIGFVEGRPFDRTYVQDSAGRSFIINETAVEHFNMEDPIGTKLMWMDNDTTLQGNIVGVVKDFHYKSLHTTIRPMIIQIYVPDFNEFIVKISAEEVAGTLQDIQQVYAQFDPINEFEYGFLDEKIENLYTAEVRTLSVFGIFAAIALFLACLGLLGIAIAILNQRVKEVGIRKILGANSNQIIGMIVMDFSRLIVLALILGLPLAYITMQYWVSEFPYQTTIGPLPFIWSAFILFMVAIGSVSVIVYRIAQTSPVRSLRYE